jgi:ribosomal protein S18 acetylase RimI-like enzyme
MLKLWREMMDFHAQFDPRFVPLPAPEGEQTWRGYLEADIMGHDDWCVLVAEADGCLVGHMIGQVRDPIPVFQGERFGHVADVSVTSSSRRQGIGRQLFAAMCDWFRQQGADHIRLEAAHSNPVSRAFWRDMGFTDYMVTMWRDLDNVSSDSAGTDSFLS